MSPPPGANQPPPKLTKPAMDLPLPQATYKIIILAITFHMKPIELRLENSEILAAHPTDNQENPLVFLDINSEEAQVLMYLNN